MVTEPNASEVGVTAPCGVPGAGLPTVSVKVTDPFVPLLAHARMITLCAPGAILTLVLMLFVDPV